MTDPREVHAEDQERAEGHVDFAVQLRSHYGALILAGFTREQAMRLTEAYQTTHIMCSDYPIDPDLGDEEWTR